jgi:hypothetical protein
VKETGLPSALVIGCDKGLGVMKSTLKDLLEGLRLGDVQQHGASAVSPLLSTIDRSPDYLMLVAA